MQEEKKELQKQYEELFGKKPSFKWDAKELQSKIDKFDTEEVEDTAIFKGIKIDPKRRYHFRLKHRANPQTFLPREAKVWDEDTERTRTIRLCSVENSPYIDEQQEDAHTDATAAVFIDGNLYINGTEANKIKFVLAFDGYDKKKTILPMSEDLRDMYELVDEDKFSIANLNKEEAILDAKMLIKGSKMSDIKNFMRSVFLLSVDQMSDSDVKTSAYASAETNPYTFLNEFTNPIHEVKANIQKLFGLQMLIEADGAVKWADNGGVILTYNDKKERADDALAKFVILGEKPAKEFKERMESKLKN